jgi:hypothetical protein
MTVNLVNQERRSATLAPDPIEALLMWRGNQRRALASHAGFGVVTVSTPTPA